MSRFYTSMERRGSKVYLRYADTETRKRGSAEVDFKPRLYVAGEASKAVAKDMKGNPLEAIDFDSMKEMADFIERYRGVDGYRLFGARDPLVQFVAKYFPGELKFDPDLIEAGFIDIEVFSGDIDADGNVIPGPFPKPEEAKYPISMLTIYHKATDTYHTWALEWFKGRHLGTYVHNPDNERTGPLKVVYKGFDNEQDMLNDMLVWYASKEFDATTGWFYEEFDVPYMVNRIRAVCGNAMANKMSPWGVIKDRTIKSVRGDIPTYEFMGSSVLDMLNLFKKHAYMEPPDWKLGTVAEIVLGEGKISYEEEGSINNLYVLNFQKSVEYNIIDVERVVKLDEKMQFLLLSYTLSYLCKCNYPDSMATVKPWTSLLYSRLHEEGVETELRGLSTIQKDIIGGYVKEVIPGKYRWAVSGDLNSLYPHLMQQFNLGVETIVEPYDLPPEVNAAIPTNFTIDDLVDKKIDLSVLKKYDIAMSANRQFFRRDKMSIANRITREIYTNRAAVKKVMKGVEQKLVDLQEVIKKDGNPRKAEVKALEIEIATLNNRQQAFKILMNGFYGAMANKYFLEFYDIRIAEAITSSGQVAIKWISRKLNEYLNKLMGFDGSAPDKMPIDFVIANDTDSCYMCLAALVDRIFKGADKTDDEVEKVTDFLDTLFKKKIEPYIDECYKELAEYMNAHDQRMFMKRETIAPAAIWVAKKRYIMHAKDVEGVRYPKPKVKFTGVDAKRSSVPKRCRKWLIECYETALAGNEKDLHEQVKKYREEYMKLPHAEIAGVTGVNGLEQHSHPVTVYGKGAPRHVKATLFHNKMVRDLGLNIKEIQSGDKILIVSLKKGAPYGMEAIAFQGGLPKEFGLDKFVDYPQTFDKTFVDPLMNLLTAINWSAAPRASVMDFFS